MKKLLLILVTILLLVIVAGSGAVIYVKFVLPDVGPAPNLHIEATPGRLENGRYLVHVVGHCLDCHSTRDFSKFSGPIVPKTLGKGGARIGQAYARNITPAGIARYTDGELYRVITTGVTKEGKALFPIMPYSHYGKMDDEDIYSIIVYLRTLEPIENSVPETVFDFPMNLMINTMPQKRHPEKRPDRKDKVAYGKYVVNAALCMTCHTQDKKGELIESLAFGGGREFHLPGSIVRSANITPDDETGIGKWTEQNFIQRFKVYADSAYVIPNVKPGEFNSVMPWTIFAQMKEEDLAAIYAYLRTVTPLKNNVVKFTKE